MINLKNVSVSYEEKIAVKNVSLDLNENNYCIIGPNGSGKTSLLKAIAKLIDFDGEIIVNSKSIKEVNIKDFAKMLSMLRQTSASYFDFTVFDTIMMGRYSYQNGGLFSGKSEQDIVTVTKCLEMVDLLDVKDRLITELSGGQLQRVYLARVLAQEPKIILLDEPTNHLDIKYQIELVDYLKKWSLNDDRQVIGVFHDLNLARRFSSNFVLMKNGEVIANGGIGEEITSEILEATYRVNVVNYMKDSFEIWNKI